MTRTNLAELVIWFDAVPDPDDSLQSTSGVCMAASAASCNFLTMGSGAPLGKKNAFQV
jgi:hypothetical protein